MHQKLTEPQQLLIDQLRTGATMRHEVQPRGLYRLSHHGRARTVHPYTVDSLLKLGVLSKDLAGRVSLAGA